jgi:hypothetical protein
MRRCKSSGRTREEGGNERKARGGKGVLKVVEEVCFIPILLCICCWNSEGIWITGNRKRESEEHCRKKWNGFLVMDQECCSTYLWCTPWY